MSRRFATVVTLVIVVAFVVVAVAPAFAATPASLALHARLLLLGAQGRRDGRRPRSRSC